MNPFNFYTLNWFSVCSLLLAFGLSNSTAIDNQPKSTQLYNSNLTSPLGSSPQFDAFRDTVECEPGFYQTVGNGILVIYSQDGFSLGFDTIADFGSSVNATAYNPIDNYLYTIRSNNNHLMRIHGDGTYNDLGPLNLPVRPLVGDFDAEGDYYVTVPGWDIYKINVLSNNVETLTLNSAQEFYAYDWAYATSENKFYGVSGSTLYAFDPVTVTVEATTITGILPGETNGFGGAFPSVDGFIYVSNNASGRIYRIDLTNSVATYVIDGPSSGTNDGAGCPYAFPPIVTMYAVNDSACISNGGVINIILNDNASITEIDYESYELIYPPLHGTVTYNEETGEITYISDNPLLEDNFVYRICALSQFNICDEAVVNFQPSFDTFIEGSICDGEEYFYQDSVFTTAGVYSNMYNSVMGCDSLVRLELEVNPNYEEMIYEEICPGEIYTFADSIFSESGIYDFNFITENNCDSLISIDLVIKDAYLITVVEQICFGENYMVGDSSYTQSGLHLNLFEAQNGCDSLVSLNLEVEPIFTSIREESICSSEGFTIHDSTYFETGFHEIHYFAQNGCDSMVTLDLEVLPEFSSSHEGSICEGQSFPFGNSIFTEAGLYNLEFLAENGCDSLVSLDLEVRSHSLLELEERLCDGTEFLVGNNAYSESGFYTNVFISENGCDSTVTLDLIVDPIYSFSREESICEGEIIRIGQNEFSSTGIYELMYESMQGCDSLITLVLEVREEKLKILDEVICEGDFYTLGNNNFYSAGQFTDTFQSSNGCDSTVVLNLQVSQVYSNLLETGLCNGESISIGTEIFSEAGFYEVFIQASNGCDSLISLDLDIFPHVSSNLSEEICEGDYFTMGSYNYHDSGSYSELLQSHQGCDSMVFLDLLVKPNSIHDITAYLCNQETFQVGTDIFSETGLYEIHLEANNSCDSLVNLEIIKNYDAIENINLSLCYGESANIGDDFYSETGMYQNYFSAANGCDSIVNLTLEIKDTYDTFDSQEICQGESVFVDNSELNVTGIYDFVYQAQNGCDSIFTLDLKVKQHKFTELDQVICEGSLFDVGDNSYSEAGFYTHTFVAANGCDSIVDLDLRVEQIYSTNIIEEICPGAEVIVANEIYSAEGNYEIFINASNGCDSIIYLEVSQIFNTETFLVEEICEGEIFSLGDTDISNAGNFSELYQAANGCDSTVYLDLFIKPKHYSTAQIEICNGDTYTVGDSIYTNAGSYLNLFSAIDGCDSIVTTEIETFPLSTTYLEFTTCEEAEVGQISYFLEDLNGCDSLIVEDTYLREENECYLIAEIYGDIILCSEQRGSINLIISVGKAPFNIQWSGTQSGNMTFDNVNEIITIVDLPKGNYIIEITDANGREDIFEYTLSQQETPEIFIQNALTYTDYNISCFGASDGSAIVAASGGLRPYQFIWSTGFIGEEISDLTAGTYQVSIIDANGCLNVTELILNQPEPVQLQLEGVDTDCFDHHNGSIEILADGGQEPYSYSINGGSYQNESLFLNLSQGNYQISIQDRYGCENSDNISIFTPLGVDVELGADYEIFAGESIDLEAQVNLPNSQLEIIAWTGLESDACQNCLDQIVSPIEDTNYSIVITDANGCTDLDEIQVRVKIDESVYVPSAFSPNGDGINDLFLIYADPDRLVRVNEFHIYDRWGNKVFFQKEFLPNDLNYGWDGSYRDEVMNPSVFVWYAIVEFADGTEKILKGDVSLIK